MLALTPAERRELRAQAHRLHPVVSVGQPGLTPGVLHEIDVNLLAHELIKVRVFDDDRRAREALLARICTELGAAPVQHIGKLLVLWRPAPPKPEVDRSTSKPRSAERGSRAATPRRRGAQTRSGSTPPISAAKSTPQVRRPRSPLPRAPARPPAGPSGRIRQQVPPTGGRRRRRQP
ncbi:MAG TPA: YhbY family RNA-binding protein [Casimicrobiaceae bacterium]